ncbi:hypothetical protein EKG38_02035 [Shewanella canadensis]|uniref:Uncharacterized protein n=1 Tax=Shewanella canadensis TaxID=271096 RepID=A0A431WYW8_9GAMM|nr:hypothetical protein [Shewanella canadensis]RTR40717.1 hypothetical protein EKG38_02035 [Shewanella canadensis]
MRFITLTAILVFTASCSSDEANKEPQVLNAKSVIQDLEKRDATVSEQSLSRLKLSTNGSTSYELNGEKFIVQEKTLSRGLRVFNHSMSEFGVLKGTFVVQTLESIESLTNQFNVEEIASQTYRLTPLYNKADLLPLYRSLQGEKQFSTVEIEIDYSPLDNSEKY